MDGFVTVTARRMPVFQLGSIQRGAELVDVPTSRCKYGALCIFKLFPLLLM